MKAVTEKPANKINGFIILFLFIALWVLNIYLLVQGIKTEETSILWIFIPLTVILFILMGGFLLFSQMTREY